MREEVRRSKRWRNNGSFDDLWRRMIDLYNGRQYSGLSKNDRLVVNLMFATKNVIAPSVAINNPRFTVNARKPDNAPMAVIVEEVLNYLWRCHKYQDEIRLAVDDWIVCGHGWVKCGYKFTKEPVSKKSGEPDHENTLDPGDDEGVDDRAPVPGNVETEMTITDDRPFVERISIFDMFVDPDARHPKEMRWVAQRTWRALSDVKVDERYSATARRQVSATSWSRWDSETGDGRDGSDKPDQGSVSYCEIVEFYDLKRRVVATFAMDGDQSTDGEGSDGGGFLIKPASIPYGFGAPFKMLRNYEVPDNFYPMGELESVESLQLELNETRNQMLNHRKRFARKWIYARDVFDEEGVRALESDVDNTMIPALGDGNPANYIAPLPSDWYPTGLLQPVGDDRRGHQHRHRHLGLHARQPGGQHPAHRHRSGDDPGRRQCPGPRQTVQSRVVPLRGRRSPRAADAAVHDRRTRCPDHECGWSSMAQLRRRLPPRLLRLRSGRRFH